MAEDLFPWEGLDLWEAVLRVLWVHRQNLFTAWRAQDLDDLNELVDATLSREDGLSQHQFGDDATDGPDVDVRTIV